MRAIGIDADHELQMFDIPAEPVGPGQARIRTTRVGVCGTDREIVHTGAIFKLPPGEDRLVLGHEASGIVEQVGEGVTDIAPGDVVVPTLTPDRNRGIDSHGWFRDAFVEDAEHLVKIPRALADVAMLVEPLTVTHHALRQTNALRAARTGVEFSREPSIAPQRVLVVGAGPIGLLGALLCRTWGYATVVTDLLEARTYRAQVAQAAGCEYFDARELAAKHIAADYGRFDIVLQASPPFEPLLEYLELLDRDGVFNLVGWEGGSRSAPVDLATLIRDAVHREWAIVGTLGARDVDFRAVVERLWVMHESFPEALSSMITSLHAPDDYQAAFDAGPDELKVGLDFTMTRGQ